VYDAIRSELAAGGRAFIVCALVSESTASEGMRAVETEAARLAASGVFGTHPVALVHGRLSAGEQADALARFASGEAPVLISSTVVEARRAALLSACRLPAAAARFHRSNPQTLQPH
jgi:ATP-dependent DNA helicase RecG